MTRQHQAPFDYSISLHPSWMEVDLDALAHNYRQVERMVGSGTKIIASVKGNGYGLGVVQASRQFQRLGAHAVATGSFKDALAIRQAGLDIKVQMFPGNLPEGIPELLHHELIPSVYNMETARMVSSVATKPVATFIKVDCGLARLGVHIDEAEDFIRQVSVLPNLVIEGIYTHLPFENAAGLEWALPRLKQFDDLIVRLKQAGIEPPVTQSIASAAAVCGVKSICSTVCVGHLLYGGLDRVTPDMGDLSQLRPALKSVKSKLIHIALHPADTTAGSGGQQRLKGGSCTGVIPIGLYDGYRPAARDRKPMTLVRGVRVPVMYITQEYSVLNLTEIGDPQLGEEVVVLGQDGDDEITIEEMAEWTGDVPLRVLMSFNERFPCRYFGDQSEDHEEGDALAVGDC